MEDGELIYTCKMIQPVIFQVSRFSQPNNLLLRNARFSGYNLEKYTGWPVDWTWKKGQVGSFYRYRLIPHLLTIIFFRAVGVPIGRVQVQEVHKKENDFRIDSVEVTGDCCWEIESNDGDFETVDPENPTDISMFLSQLSSEYTVQASNYCF